VLGDSRLAMPTWAWIVVTLAAASGSGIVGTLVRVSYERHADLRRRALEATEAFASSAAGWLDAVTAARDERWETGIEEGLPDPEYRAAAKALQEAQAKVHSLLVLVPVRSETAQKALSVVTALELAMAELQKWPPEPEEPGIEADEGSRDSEEEAVSKHEFDPIEEALDEAHGEATLWLDAGRSALGAFVEAASVELRRGYVSDLWRAVGELRLIRERSQKTHS